MTGADPLPSWQHMVGAEHSLRRQAMIGQVLEGTEPGHHDSWGVGWFDDSGQISLLRQTGSASDSAFYVFAAEAAQRQGARIVLGHLRKASVGAVISENAHPIRIDPLPGEGRDSLLMAHNGTLNASFLESLREDLRERGRSEASSDNDTVILAAWLAGRIDPEARGESLADALRDLISRGADDPVAAYTGINLLIGLSGSLYALRWFSKAPDYYTLWRKPLENGGWLVASERTDSAPEWEALTPGRLYTLTGDEETYDLVRK
ncbi:MAG: class II glutamine amidotransferase [Armatimonas sp.]